MLAAMLLHVIEPAGPVDTALDLCTLDCGFRPVSDPIGVVDDFDYRHAGNPAGIVRLASGSRVKSRPVQIDEPPIGRASGDVSAKFPQVRIRVIKPLRLDHRFPIIRCDMPTRTCLALISLTLFDLQAAEKLAAPRLIEMARQKSHDLVETLRASLGEEQIKKGTAFA